MVHYLNMPAFSDLIPCCRAFALFLTCHSTRTCDGHFCICFLSHWYAFRVSQLFCSSTQIKNQRSRAGVLKIRSLDQSTHSHHPGTCQRWREEGIRFFILTSFPVSTGFWCLLTQIKISEMFLQPPRHWNRDPHWQLQSGIGMLMKSTKV